MSSMGSYYTADYYQNPTPYESSDIGEPVPGWGTTVSIAGPSRLGVGAYGADLNIAKAAASLRHLSPETLSRLRSTARQRDTTTTTTADTGNGESQPDAPSKPLPWWIWPAAAAVLLGGVGYYGTKKGWL